MMFAGEERFLLSIFWKTLEYTFFVHVLIGTRNVDLTSFLKEKETASRKRDRHPK